MIRQLATLIFTFAAALFCAAQAPATKHSPRAVTHEHADRYAALVRPDLTRHLPDIELRRLDLIHDDISEEMHLAGDLISYARTYLGTRYRRGGKTPAGFDCSGFTSYIFRQFGYSLNASSGAQFSDGVAIDDSDIRPGDLLFFRGRAAKSSRIGHVAIAIDYDPATGVATFIHASCSEGIAIHRTSAPYYAQRYVGARRILGQ